MSIHLKCKEFVIIRIFISLLFNKQLGLADLYLSYQALYVLFVYTFFTRSALTFLLFLLLVIFIS